jgi:hypothetical protein
MVDEQRRVGLRGGTHAPRLGRQCPWQGMEAEGIDVAVIYPSRGLFALIVPDLEFRSERRSYWIPGAYALALSEKRHSF